MTNTQAALVDIAEPLSSWSHLGGAVAFLYLGLRHLPEHRCTPVRFACVLAFGVATVAQLALSGAYHLVDAPSRAKPVLQLLDHAAIFVLIAGTLTAVHGLLFTGAWRRRMIQVAWITCALGIALKMVFFDQTAEWLGLASYFAMGTLGLFTTVKLWCRYGARFAWPMLAGGLIYTVGALADYLRAPVLVPDVFGPHEVLHFAVLAALAIHWRFVLGVLERAPEPAPSAELADAASQA